MKLDIQLFASAADVYATAQAEALKKQLANLTTNTNAAYQGQISAAEASKQQLLNTLNKQASTVDTTYQTDAQSAYINKMLGGQTLQNQMQRLGLANSGYGVGQVLANENTYGKNLTALQTARDTSMDTINTSKATTESEYAQKIAELQAAQATATNENEKYIAEQTLAAYNQAYSNYLNNLSTQASIADSSGAPFEDNGPVTDTGVPTIKTDFYQGAINQDALTNGVYDSTKVFNTSDANGVKYQPNNVGGSALSNSGLKVKSVYGSTAYGSSGASLAGQKIWKSANGNYFVWDGSINDYIDITNDVKASKKGKVSIKWSN